MLNIVENQSASKTTKTTSRKPRGKAPRKPRAVMVDHPKLPCIEPGSTFDTLEAVLARLGVTISVMSFADVAPWSSPAAWQASMLSAGCYDSYRRLLMVPPGPGYRAALEWGIGVVTAYDWGFTSKTPESCRKLFEYLKLNITHLPPVVDELPDTGLKATDGRGAESWRADVAEHGVELVQANPDVDSVFDPEDRQEALVVWNRFHEKVLAVLPAEPDDSDYEWLSGMLGVDARALPVEVRMGDRVLVEDAVVCRDKLRAWRAAHPAPASSDLMLQAAA